MPIKEFVSIRTSLYIREDAESKGFAKPGGTTSAVPPESPADVFTHHASNDLYDVVQFTIELVVDARKVPQIVDEICKNDFHTLLRVAYQDVSVSPSSWSMRDKIYGADPAIRVVMDFETIFLGKLYCPLMPQVIRDSVGRECDEDEE